MLIDDLKPPLILHSYNPANAGVKVKKLRPRVSEPNLEEHTLSTAFLQPANRVFLSIFSEFQKGW